MVNRNLLRRFDFPEDQLAREMEIAFGPEGEEWLPAEPQIFKEDHLLTGRVLKVTAEHVLVDVGYKSEGIIELREWFNDDTGQIVPPVPGDEVQLLLQSFEDESGAVVLSYRKARWQRAWQEAIARHKEGDVVSGLVSRKRWPRHTCSSHLMPTPVTLPVKF